MKFFDIFPLRNGLVQNVGRNGVNRWTFTFSGAFGAPFLLYFEYSCSQTHLLVLVLHIEGQMTGKQGFFSGVTFCVMP